MDGQGETRASETKPDSVPDAFVGRTLDGYRVDALIGRGGMGAVYRATQLSLNRPVAIKVIPAEVAEHPQFQERFEREVDILSKLSHPNVVTVHERGEVDGRPYLVMEYVAGTSLREVIKRGPLPPSEALVIVRSVLAALEHAHEKGVVHRDIKPENVLVAPGGIVKVADFGLSRLLGPADVTRLTHTHLLLGTFEYMAPEQREKAKEADERSDLYATGVVLYELLTGELPIGKFESPSAKRPECDRRIDTVVERSLEKDPGKRWQRASEMGAAVSRLLSNASLESVPPPPPAPRPPAPPFAPPSQGPGARWLIGLGTAVVVFLLVYALMPRRAGDGSSVALAWPVLAIASGIGVIALLLLQRGRSGARGAAHPHRPAPKVPRAGIRGWHVAVGLLLLWLVGVMADASSGRGLDWGVLVLGGAGVALVMWWLVTKTGRHAHGRPRAAPQIAAGVAFWLLITFGGLLVFAVLGYLFMGVRESAGAFGPKAGRTDALQEAAEGERKALEMAWDRQAQMAIASQRHGVIGHWTSGKRPGFVEEWSKARATVAWLAGLLDCSESEAARFRVACLGDQILLMLPGETELDWRQVAYAYAWALERLAPGEGGSIEMWTRMSRPEEAFMERVRKASLPVARPEGE